MNEAPLNKSILEKICTSEQFRNADKYCELLQYLFEATAKGSIPKEYSIAIDVLKKPKNFNPSQDTIVRYYMHRLRQKLEDYYKNSGKEDEVRLIIPKGHYKVKFQQAPKRSIKNNSSLSHGRTILFIAVFLLLSFSAFLNYKYFSMHNSMRFVDDPISLNDPIWSSFFHNNLETVLLVGDHYIFLEYDKEIGRDRYIIDHNITIVDCLNTFKTTFPERKITRLDQGSLPLNSIFNLSDLSHVFNSFSKKVKIELSSTFMSSQFDSQKLNDKNIIYIGGFRNLRQLKLVVEKIPLAFNYSPTDYWRGDITVHPNDSDTTLSFHSSILDDGQYSDLGLVAKLPGNKEENYLILTGFAYPAQTEIVRLLSRNSSLEEIYKEVQAKFDKIPDYFLLVFEVIGSEYSAIETKVIYSQEIKKIRP